jgi:hypothetical protein
MAGIEKPLIAPREPNSLAQVGVSPLTAAGNLWLWQPQARVEQRFRLAPDAGLRAQLSLFQTSERNATADPAFLDSLEQARPGLEGRFELWKDFGEGRRLEFAPGFHTSQTHVGGRSLPSRIFSLDWMLRPLPSLDFSGTWFRGSNVAVLGSMRQGVVPSLGRSVQAQGGWAQLSWRTTSRLTFNVYGGQQDDRNRDLIRGLVAKNQTWAANFIYRLGPNVLASFEAYKIRTTYLGSGNRMVNHYDLALAYLF